MEGSDLGESLPSFPFLSQSWDLRQRTQLTFIPTFVSPDFQATLNFPARLPVLYYLARLHHTMGDFDSRDSVAEEHEKVENAVKQLRGSRVPEDWDRLNEIEEIVAMVGGMVGNGWE